MRAAAVPSLVAIVCAGAGVVLAGIGPVEGSWGLLWACRRMRSRLIVQGLVT